MTSTPRSRFAPGPFREGDRVQLSDARGKRHTITLVSSEEFHTHRGAISHDAIIGKADGSVIESSSGTPYLALRPLLSDFVMSMPRGAAIIYPKDAQVILGQADLFPGARVVEAGVGSGALSLWLLRAISDIGHLYSFERREEFGDIAQANVETFYGYLPENWSLHLGDVQDELPVVCKPESVDRVILDMLAPWECIDAVAQALVPGGVLLIYVATVTQLSRTVEAIRESQRFTHPQSSETIVRGWHVEGLAVRPDHRMIGHTAFIVTARKLAPGVTIPQPKRRASKSNYTEDDVATWQQDDFGGKVISDKALRKKVRSAKERSEQSRGE